MAGRFVTLLRGINVGKSRRVSMADLRALLEALGYRDVTTLLNSGNAVFTADARAGRAAAERIEKGLEERLGVRTRVIVLSAAELARVLERNPLEVPPADASRLIVGIVGTPADLARLSAISRRDWGGERLVLGPARAFYLSLPRGVIASRLYAAVTRALGDEVTARTWATMLKLREAARSGRTAPAYRP